MHYFWPGPIVLRSEVVHYIGIRVPFEVNTVKFSQHFFPLFIPEGKTQGVLAFDPFLLVIPCHLSVFMGSYMHTQALRVELVPYLLRLLEGIGLETLDNPSATKAQIVKALKSMTRSLHYGEQVRHHDYVSQYINPYINNILQYLLCVISPRDIKVDLILSSLLLYTSISLRDPVLQVNEILNRSTVWSAFKDQKHDLFISESQTAGYITGGDVIHRHTQYIKHYKEGALYKPNLNPFVLLCFH